MTKRHMNTQAIKEELDNMKAQQVYDEVNVKDVPEGTEIVHSTIKCSD